MNLLYIGVSLLVISVLGLIYAFAIEGFTSFGATLIVGSIIGATCGSALIWYSTRRVPDFEPDYDFGQQQQQRQQQYNRLNPDLTESECKRLMCAEGIHTLVDWKSWMMRNHPDKLMQRGVPQEQIDVLQKKSQIVNDCRDHGEFDLDD